MLLEHRNPWTKFLRRDFLIENEITFPKIISGGDFIWTIHVYCCSKRFLKLATPLYFYRSSSSESVSRKWRAPAEQVFHWAYAFVAWMKSLNSLAEKTELLKENPAYCSQLLSNHFDYCLNRCLEARTQLSTQEIYEILFREFAKESTDLTVPFFFSNADAQRKEITKISSLLGKLKVYFTARADIKFVPKGEGDFQIISISDEKANIWKPAWFQRGGIGYQIQSYAGNMEIVAKASADGKIKLDLRGLDMKDPNDKSKRIPYWIDYTNLTVNGKIVFDTLMPVWHDKAYNYILDVKADEEIKIKTKWLPHRADTEDVSANAEDFQSKSAEKDTLINKLQVTLDNEKKAADKQKILISELQAALDNEKKIHNGDAELIRNFSDYFTSRIDLRLVPNGEGKLQIVSVSDDKATVKRAGWLPKNESGYFIQSYVGKMEIIAKPTADGQINLDLRGLDVRNPEDRSKKIPYWIDYTKLSVNGEVIFEERLPIWHNKPFRYKLDVKADEEIKIAVEWQPHRSDT